MAMVLSFFLTGLVTGALRPHLPSGKSATGSPLAGTAGTFGAFPFAHMIPALQSGGLRKHSPVRLTDLLQT